VAANTVPSLESKIVTPINKEESIAKATIKLKVFLANKNLKDLVKLKKQFLVFILSLSLSLSLE
jgi:hypothetical protein